MATGALLACALLGKSCEEATSLLFCVIFPPVWFDERGADVDAHLLRLRHRTPVRDVRVLPG